MTNEGQEKLLKAYRMAIKGGLNGVADMLEAVILEEMRDTSYPLISLSDSQTTTKPPWKVTCMQDAVPLGTMVTSTGIDHPSNETMV